MFRDRHGIYILRASYMASDGTKITAASHGKKAFKIYLIRF